MGLIARSLQSVTSLGKSVSSMPFVAMSSGSSGGMGSAAGPQSYLTFASKGYARNEIVFAAIELLATSAAEPHIVGRRWRRERRHVDAQRNLLQAFGVTNRAGAMRQDALLLTNGFFEEVPEHPLVRILNNPNPYMSRGQLWSTVVMDLKLAGNAYVLKARYPKGHMLEGAVAELWRLRPDRVRVKVSNGQLAGYTYTVGQESWDFPIEDIMHFKTRNPFDAFYGMPPMMAISGRIDIDNYMREFLKTFFERGGTGPGAILSTKGEMEQSDKDEARDRFTRMMGGGGYVAFLILDNSEDTTWTQLGLNRGLRDALPKEIDAQNEARIAMAFGVPGSILGLLIGYESSSYANKRQDWQVLWDITMTPLLSDMDDVMNLSLTREFGGIDEVHFDLRDIRALQEDEDRLQDRARKNFVAGGWSFEEFRTFTGVPEARDGTFFVPGNVKPTPFDRLGEEPEVPSQPAQLMEAAVRMMLPAPDLNDEGRTGRPRLEDDEGARAIWAQAVSLRASSPELTWSAIATRVGVVERTLRNYRARFEDDA